MARAPVAASQQEKFERDEAGYPVFVLGLTMAGAVSAGAYTAGVLDFLFRAIDAHNEIVEKGRADGDTSAPRHKIVVKSMSGASAGGMCTGLSVASLVQAKQHSSGRLLPAFEAAYETQPKPQGAPPNHPPQATCRYALGPIFDAWVTNIKLWEKKDGSEDFEGFLGTKDLEPYSTLLGMPSDEAVPDPEKNPLWSALDSTHLDDAASAALRGIDALAADRTCSFIADELDIFITTSNLLGVPYEVRFASTDDSFWMSKHDTVRHFRVNGLGRDKIPSPWLVQWNDIGIELDPTSRDSAGHLPLISDHKSPWHALTIASIASGAFPIGLAPRYVASTATELGLLHSGGFSRGGALPMELPEGLVSATARPNLEGQAMDDDLAGYVSVDGGVMNNEPFELARYAIRRVDPENGKTLLANPREGDKAHRAVIMIDPFPEGDRYMPLTVQAARQLGSLVTSALKLLPTLIKQARFKPSEVLNASDASIYSRFLIAPSRSDPSGRKDEIQGADAIACGTLDGFSGFFDHSFRMHDFILGQRNCQRFLQMAFVLDADNPLLQLDADDPAVAQARALRKSERDDEIRKTPGLTRRIVDIPESGFEDLSDEVYEPLWPAISPLALKGLKDQAKIRFDRVARHLIDAIAAESAMRILLNRAWYGVPGLMGGAQKKLLEAVSKIVLETFILRGQVQAYGEFSPAVSQALAFMLSKEDHLSSREVVQAMRDENFLANQPEDLQIPSARELEKALRELLEKGLAEKPWHNVIGETRYRLKLG